jgi:hypothetical protein
MSILQLVPVHFCVLRSPGFVPKLGYNSMTHSHHNLTLALVSNYVSVYLVTVCHGIITQNWHFANAINLVHVGKICLYIHAPMSRSTGPRSVRIYSRDHFLDIGVFVQLEGELASAWYEHCETRRHWRTLVGTRTEIRGLL